MSKAENPTADLEALWCHVGKPDRFQGVNAGIDGRGTPPI